MTSEKARWLPHLCAGILIAAFLLINFSELRRESPTSDEPPHIAAGLSYFVTHEIFRANPQHPPLLKELSALFLMAAGVRWPKTEQADYLANGDDPARVFALDWPIGNDLIQRNGADRVMFWARLPMVLVAGMLAVFLYLLGRQLLGSAAAAGGVFVLVLDPNIIAHSHLVTTDVGMTAFAAAFLYALWHYIQQPGWIRLVICGLLLGCALVTKFSAIFLLPIGGVLLLVGLLRRREATPARLGITALMGVFAIFVIEAVYFFPSDLMMYVKCAQMVNADHDPNYLNYMAGGFSTHFLSYFLVAWLLKEPIPLIVLSVIGLVALWRSKTIDPLARLFIFVPAGVFFLAVTIWADDIGIRYLIPAMPFLALAAGLGLTTLFQKRGWIRYAAGALCAWTVVAAVGVYPDHLSYFNEAACLLTRPGQTGWDGGTRCGPEWLDDSNVDWGQALKQLKDWQDRNPSGRTVKLAAFSTYPPQAYGIRFEPLDQTELAKDPKPGLYVVSAHLVARIPVYPGASDWLRRVRPKAIIGHSLYVYDIPGGG